MYNVPYMNFDSDMTTWKDLHELIISPFSNQFNTYVRETLEEQERRRMYMEGRTPLGTRSRFTRCLQ